MATENKVVEVELKWKEKMKVLSFIRDLNPIMIEDLEKGDKEAPSPVEMFLTSIGACLIMSFIYCLSISGVDLKPNDFQVKVLGTVGRIADRLRLIDVKAHFIIKSREDNLKIQKCFNKFQPFCILSESIHGGIAFSCDLKFEGKK
jgi:uncharacterized OsmC-like protein